MRLLLVHGRAQGGRSKDELLSEWLSAWDRGLERAGLSRPSGLDVELPFYGDLLDDFVDKARQKAAQESFAPNEAQRNRAMLEQELARALQQNAKISDKQVHDELPKSRDAEGIADWLAQSEFG